MIRKLMPLVLFLACLCRLAPAWAQTGVHCGSDLAKLHALALPHASLLSHRTQESMAQPTQKLCEATYVVPGKHARTVEAMLMRKYGMGKLVFTCCGWSPENGKAGYFRRSHRMADGAEAVYEISMSSEETQEKSWEKIGRFYVTLTILAI